MPIHEYTDQHGNKLYRARVDLRSSREQGLRISRKKSAIKSFSEAQKIERSMFREAQSLLYEKEVKGEAWGDLVERWYDFNVNHVVALGSRSPTTVLDYRDGVLKWTNAFKFQIAANLTHYDFVEVFSKMKAAKISFDFQRKLKRVMTEILEFGISQGYIAEMRRLPTADVVLKKTEPAPPEILSIKEIQRLLDCAFQEEHPWRHVWAFALLTGMRNGELYALHWDDVDWESKLLTVSKSYNGRLKIIKSTKAGYWRSVPISDELAHVLMELKNITGDEKFVLPRLPDWKRGMQAHILRSFCVSNGLQSVKFHTLRACFATQLIRQGVEPAKVMKVAGWRDLKTMQHYIRLAGIEITGVTDSLKILPPTSVMANVVSLTQKKGG